MNESLTPKIKRKSGSFGALASFAFLLAVAGFGAVYFIGNKGPHGHFIRGTVSSERELYGNALTGYATERSGVTGLLERKANDLIRPGEPMRLYTLAPTTVEYDTIEWFKTMHHVEQFEPSKIPELRNRADLIGQLGIPVQTEGDIADEGDYFEADSKELGRFSNTFFARGVRYEVKNEKGKPQVIELKAVLKEPGAIKFTKSKK